MITPTKSTTCFGEHGALTVYFSRSTAQRAAARAAEQCGREFEAYKCHKCKRWHTSPVHSGIKSNACGCTSASGELKTLYVSKEDAQRGAESVYRKKGFRLYAYSCSRSDGWHLTANIPY